MTFQRKQIATLRSRFDEAPTYIIVVTGPRQIGKSTLVQQAIAGRHWMFISADRPRDDFSGDETIASTTTFLPDASVSSVSPASDWLVSRWRKARAEARAVAKAFPENKPYIFVIDEIQKIPKWSETVKGLWDEDRAERLAMHVVLLGSSPWLMQKGLTESLAGRFESIRMSHWSYLEMEEAFNFSLAEYIYFGGYPGSASLIRDESRWREYVRDSLIKTNIEKDIIEMIHINKPALLKAMFELGCIYSGQIISYTKLQGQLKDAGNTVTLAHYLNLLSQAGFLTGLTKYAAQAHRQRAASPKLIALNTALISALTRYTFDEARADRSYWGRLVESAIGSHLFNTAFDNCQVQYWHESSHEVDFILTNGLKRIAIEVKSGADYNVSKGIEIFNHRHGKTRLIVVGEKEGDIPLAEFLSKTANEWLDKS